MSSVLVVDGTGRGHAICDLFVRTDPAMTVYYGPGGGAIDEPRIVTVDRITFDDPSTALDFLAEQPVDFVFVSNIDALSVGYADVLSAAGHRVIGPSREAASLEASKERGKRFCAEYGLPTAAFTAFTDPEAARKHVREVPHACVVKTDGLTPDGDGAVVCDTAARAEDAVDAFAAEQGEDFHVVVEERLYGREISVFALLDGENYLMFPTGLDFKRVLEGDGGKNCDGMGSVAPHPDITPALEEEIRRVLLDPFMTGIRAEGLRYTGFVYIGAMITADGLRTIEINARFGDSEAEAVLPGVRSDFGELCHAVLDGELDRFRLDTDGRVRCSVALTQGGLGDAADGDAPGWPFGRFETGQPVRGLDAVDQGRARLFHANIAPGAGGDPVTTGGRVLHAVGSGDTLAEARAAAYGQIGRISFPGMRYRADIGEPPSAPTSWAEPGTLATGKGLPMALAAGDGTVFEENESAVRSYSRSFPAVFTTAKNDRLYTADDTCYVDFLSGAGTLNYGHNPEPVKEAVLAYLRDDGLVHGLDMATAAKAEFLRAFRECVLDPRDLDYRVQFTSPSGTNAVEAALKLARLVTGRTNVVSFSGGFHGVSTAALSATGSGHFRQGLEDTLPTTTHIPYPDSPLGEFDSLGLLRRLLDDESSGVERPAAVLIETVQGEGGIYVAPDGFLRELRELCDQHGMLLIVDDIQAGCGRTGAFFSFEHAGIVPDLVTLSKSIGGYGLPMALLLIAPELDVWRPGQHNGTFRGHQLAFVAATAALRHYWSDPGFAAQVVKKGELVGDCLQRRVAGPFGARVRGRGLMYGIDLSPVEGVDAAKVSRLCFEKGLVAEACGRRDEVLKLLPPLTISQLNLSLGLDTIVAAITELAENQG
ncbi:diaminobutyrate--2-oxoglutarate transaminase [Streptomyces sp. AJS327]|uniref:diaminobutyrate--2-oxoglutarate transaminase n=1 Tax=Streptomyces sp. AJS327 TaxID=2545265 RepID=UPI0015DD9458|nr:diaminobutyrate--2-oxoglutarate transaminase [Streptomyces sp. AJS327]